MAKKSLPTMKAGSDSPKYLYSTHANLKSFMAVNGVLCVSIFKDNTMYTDSNNITILIILIYIPCLYLDLRPIALVRKWKNHFFKPEESALISTSSITLCHLYFMLQHCTIMYIHVLLLLPETLAFWPPFNIACLTFTLA